jgi:hypothetical protein
LTVLLALSMLALHVPSIVEAMVSAAKVGDVGAAKLILERTVPSLRPEEMPVTLDGISGSRVEMGAAVVQAIASGTLDTVRGGRLIAVLGPEEIQEKLERLESMMIAEQNDEQ